LSSYFIYEKLLSTSFDLKNKKPPFAEMAGYTTSSRQPKCPYTGGVHRFHTTQRNCIRLIQCPVQNSGWYPGTASFQITIKFCYNAISSLIHPYKHGFMLCPYFNSYNYFHQLKSFVKIRLLSTSLDLKNNLIWKQQRNSKNFAIRKSKPPVQRVVCSPL